MDELLDEKIKIALLKGTDASIKQKAAVWERIQLKIKEENKMMGGKKMVKRKNWLRGILAVGTIAAMLFVVFFFTTPSGRAAVDKIKEMFVPEKKIIEEIEGTKEENNAVLQEGSVGYVIYFDQERYKMDKNQEWDRILPKVDMGDLPEVYMEIRQIKGKTPDQLQGELEQQLNKEYSDVKNYGQVQNPIKGIAIRALDGKQWNSTLVKYYLVDDTQGGSFVIKQKFFLEAEEGHGARFDNMLEEFRIIALQGE